MHNVYYTSKYNEIFMPENIILYNEVPIYILVLCVQGDNYACEQIMYPPNCCRVPEEE